MTTPHNWILTLGRTTGSLSHLEIVKYYSDSKANPNPQSMDVVQVLDRNRVNQPVF